MTLNKEEVKFRIKGHESFYIREGWLRKGIKNIEKDPKFFSNEYATDILGVGSNMVKSIRYWLQVTGLTRENVVKGGKREQCLTEDFGSLINLYDPYFEDIFTLWLIHYKIATNSQLCTTWYLFFNQFKAEEFTKDDMFESIKILLNKFTYDATYSEKSLYDDCNCLVRTYFIDKDEERNPEENNVCILTELGLMDSFKATNGKVYYTKKMPSIEKLDKLLILYIILDNLKERNNISINELENDECNVGKIFNLDRNLLNQYLDLLKGEGYIEINRTAGLDRIYVKDITKNDILKIYYEQL